MKEGDLEQHKWGVECRGIGGRKVSLLNRVIQISLTEKVTFEQTFEREGCNHVATWVQNNPGKRNSWF